MRRFSAVIVFLILMRVGYGQTEKENVFLHPDKFYKKFFPHLKIKKIPVDSIYLKAYPNYLSVATRFLLPKIYTDINPIGPKSEGAHASSEWRTNVNTILGFSGSYKFVTIGFAIALKSNADHNTDYITTKYRTATIKYNSPKYSLQFKFIKLGGLTDVNTWNNQDSLQKYSKRADVTLKEYQFEGIYNFSWKRYSYIAPIDFTVRQVKSRMGFLIKAGVYNNQLFSDTNLLTIRQRLYFEEFYDIDRVNSYSVKFAPGVGGNLVLRRKFYASVAIFTPYNLYFNRWFTDNRLIRKETSIQLVLDGTVSLGYQSKRLYAGLRYQAESKGAKLKFISTTTVFSYIGFDIGYRFRAPRIVKKVYKKTMPPGM